MTFVEGIRQAKNAMLNAGYPRTRIEVHLEPHELISIQEEPEVVHMLLEEQLRPSSEMDQPRHHGLRFLGTLYRVAFYVKEPI